jgi:hypothetical protein
MESIMPKDGEIRLDETFLTPKQLSERYGLHLRTLSNWRCGRGNAGPPFIKAGGRVLYPLSKLLIWEEARLHESGANDPETEA